MLLQWKLPENYQQNSAWQTLTGHLTDLLGAFNYQSDFPPQLRVVLQVSNSPHIQVKKGVVLVPKNWMEEAGKSLSSFSPKNYKPTLYENHLDRNLLQLKNAIHQAYAGDFWVEKSLWPQNAPFAMALTHDVDLTRKHGVKEIIRYLLEGDAGKFSSLTKSLLKGENPYWVFPEMLALYRQLGIKATFFFLAKSWEGWSYRYWIGSPKFRRLFREIKKNGHQIGLHSSLHAHFHQNSLRIEKIRLEKVLGESVQWVRQHYLNCQFPDAWYNYRDSGLFFDTTVGLNNGVGFPTGTSFPYPALDWERQQAPGIWEIPFALQDYTWKNQPTDQETLEKLLRMVQQTGGLFVVNWHPSNMAEPEFIPLWEELKGKFADANTFKGTLDEIMNWWEARRGVRVTEIHTEPDLITLQFVAEKSVPQLCLKINPAWEVENATVKLQRLKDRNSNVYCFLQNAVGAIRIKLRRQENKASDL